MTTCNSSILAVKTCLPPPGLEPGSSDCRSGALPTKLQSETSFHAYVVPL